MEIIEITQKNFSKRFKEKKQYSESNTEFFSVFTGEDTETITEDNKFENILIKKIKVINNETLYNEILKVIKRFSILMKVKESTENDISYFLYPISQIFEIKSDYTIYIIHKYEINFWENIKKKNCFSELDKIKLMKTIVKIYKMMNSSFKSEYLKEVSLSSLYFQINIKNNNPREKIMFDFLNFQKTKNENDKTNELKKILIDICSFGNDVKNRLLMIFLDIIGKSKVIDFDFIFAFPLFHYEINENLIKWKKMALEIKIPKFPKNLKLDDDEKPRDPLKDEDKHLSRVETAKYLRRKKINYNSDIEEKKIEQQPPQNSPLIKIQNPDFINENFYKPHHYFLKKYPENKFQENFLKINDWLIFNNYLFLKNILTFDKEKFDQQKDVLYYERMKLNYLYLKDYIKKNNTEINKEKHLKYFNEFKNIFFKLDQYIVEKNIKQDLFDRINKIYEFNKNFKN